MNSVENSLLPHIPDVSINPTDSFRKRMKGASEKDIVHSGLQQTMDQAAEAIIKRLVDYNLGLDLRTAAYILAIERVYQSKIDDFGA